jgi:DNA-binding CsgD family transcriptional regulator
VRRALERLRIRAFFSLQARADDLRARPIKIVVGFGASSTADTVARLVSRYMTDHVGHSVIVESRTGNSSMIAAKYVAHAANDGRTLFMAEDRHRQYCGRLALLAPQLTEREIQVCAGIVCGLSSNAIAGSLGLSVNTVLTHRRRAYAKLRVSSLNELSHMLLR